MGHTDASDTENVSTADNLSTALKDHTCTSNVNCHPTTTDLPQFTPSNDRSDRQIPPPSSFMHVPQELGDMVSEGLLSLAPHRWGSRPAPREVSRLWSGTPHPARLPAGLLRSFQGAVREEWYLYGTVGRRGIPKFRDGQVFWVVGIPRGRSDCSSRRRGNWMGSGVDTVSFHA